MLFALYTLNPLRDTSSSGLGAITAGLIVDDFVAWGGELKSPPIASLRQIKIGAT